MTEETLLWPVSGDKPARAFRMKLSHPLRSAAVAALDMARQVRVLGAATPRNAAAERARLVERWSAGQQCRPAWTYQPGAPIAAHFSKLPTISGPLGELYSARIAELVLEATLASSVGTKDLAKLANLRFPKPDARSRAQAERWLTRRVPPDTDEVIRTDSSDPRSLLSQTRALVSATKVSFRVQATPLGSLAATGEHTVYVARGPSISERHARRIAVHEVYGHVLPRARAALTHPLLALGTARGADDQEGLALVYEARFGLFDDERRVELARRHIAACCMRDGATFVEVVRLLRTREVPLDTALACACRVFRGSPDGESPGLGRESVYIASLRRVQARLRTHPEDERILASGQVAVAALETCRLELGAQFAGKQAIPDPPPTMLTA